MTLDELQLQGHTVMPVSGIFILGRVSIMLQFWHLTLMLFFAGKGLCSGDSCLDEHLFKVGRLCICTESCAAEQVFVGRHVAVAFVFFLYSSVGGDNGRMVCLY